MFETLSMYKVSAWYSLILFWSFLFHPVMQPGSTAAVQDHDQCIRIHAAMVVVSKLQRRCSFSEGAGEQRLFWNASSLQLRFEDPFEIFALYLTCYRCDLGLARHQKGELGSVERCGENARDQRHDRSRKQQAWIKLEVQWSTMKY